jgi:hypothetical protein
MARNRKRVEPRQEPEAAAVPIPEDRLTAFLSKWSRLLAVALIAIGSARIVATYTVFNHTVDELGHMACGMEWLEKGVYQWEAQHPPLARVAAAIGPYLMGLRGQGTPHTDLVGLWKEGAEILYSSHNYDRALAMARLGMLPFFWIACVTVYWWGSRYFSPATGVVALLLFSFIPPVLAHAGLTNTDMALTATLSLAFLTGVIWVEEPTRTHSVWFGVASGLMVVSKFSCLAFMPAAVALSLAAYYVKERPAMGDLVKSARQRIPTFAMAVGIAMVLIWAVYRFSFGPVSPGGASVPAPELFRGIHEVQSHLDRGHEGYLLGEIRETGFWNFYLVAIGVKTPLGLLVLTAVGVVLMFRRYPLPRRPWLPALFSLGVLLVGMTSTVNIGVRHVLPVYVGMSLVGAVGAIQLWEWRTEKPWIWCVPAGLLIWFAASSALAHPDYIPYFNELAGAHPENVLVDSDLDWGQDLKRLSKRLKEVGATGLGFSGFDYADLEKEHGFPPIHGLDKRGPYVGWNAIGFTCWKKMRIVTWPDQVKPTELVGKSILLWYVPPGGKLPLYPVRQQP